MMTTIAASRLDTATASKQDILNLPVVAPGSKRARALSPDSSMRMTKANELVSTGANKENVDPNTSLASTSTSKPTGLSAPSSRSMATIPVQQVLEDETAMTDPFCDVGCMSADGSIPRCPNPRAADSVATKKQIEEIYLRLQGKVIEVEGNIGSGKSTLTRNLHELSLKETESDEFSVVHGEKVNTEFLKAFYDNSSKYAFAFQMYMLTTRLYQMDESTRQADKENKLVFLDRGAVGDVLFALQNYKINNMNDLDMKVYKSVCTERLPKSLSERVNAVLYLDVAPRVCWYRMTTVRQREAENGVPPAYLDGIDSVYFHLLIDWLGSRKGGFHDMNIGPAPPVMIVRWNNFGCTRKVMEGLADLVEGKRASPTVSFTLDDVTILKESESKYDEIFTTQEQVDAAFQSLESENSLPFTSIAVDWSLQHNEAFRRVAMYVLAETGHVTFFGPSTAIETPTFNCPPKEAEASATSTTTSESN